MRRGQARRMVHSGWMQVTHWIGVALATPAAVIVMRASWQTRTRRRSLNPDVKETP
jgi:hypothetical protein